ncbi:MAG: OmpA family protein [Marinilabiliaceae bacterium]|nr:OmpA family protein [Marinilabiliaceae bacterium]
MKRFFVLFLFLFVSLFVVEAQNGKDKKYHTKNKKAIALYEEATDFFYLERYALAAQKYESALKMDENFIECYFALGDLYKAIGDYENQFLVLDKGLSVDSTYFPTAYYLAGVALCQMGQDTASIAYFESYKRNVKQSRQKKDTDYWIKKGKIIKNLLDNPVPFEPHIVCENLTSEFDLYWPSLTLDENEIVLTTLVPRHIEDFNRSHYLPKNSREFQEDFCMSRKVDGEWGPLTPIEGINRPDSNEGAQALSADGQWMFLTICGRSDSYGSCDLYFSRRTETGWSSPVNIGAPVNTPGWESQPCFSADGQTLYFVSNRQGGKGAHDIWSSKIESFTEEGLPKFGPVINLGDSINTPGEEASPFLHPDDKTLYFSSTGWPGLGQMDIFVARRDSSNGAWHTPVNIGYPINTPQEEIGLVINTAGNTAYYSRERKTDEMRSKRELLCFSLPASARPEMVNYVIGNVYDSESKHPLGALLELLDLRDGTKVATAHSDPKEGDFVLKLPKGKDYALIASKEGYLHHSESFTLSERDKSENVRVDMPLEPIKTGSKMTLKNIFFDFNSASLKQESHVELDKLVAIMKANPSIRVEIGGHTDNVGTAAYNMKLSGDRAKSTVEYLVSKGVDVKRIESKGYGMTTPIASNDTEEGRSQNRRIEVKIID